MPFSPLPKTFLEDLRARRGGRVVELGCGDGKLSALLAAEGARPWLLDRHPPATGTVAHVVAEVLEPPLVTASIDLMVASNLLRQLWPLPGKAAVPEVWQDCLAPGGRLYILEDEPLARPLPARNYRDLQVFLSTLDPQGRRPLLARSEFEGALARSPARGGTWRAGTARNRWPADARVVQRLLRGSRGRPGGEARRLIESIAAHGISYGSYWWACWSPEVQA